MRVLLLPASYPPVLGGLQTVVHTLATYLVRSGDTVRVVTNRHPRSLPAREYRDGVAVRRLMFLRPEPRQVTRRPDLFVAGLLCWPLALRRMDSTLRQFRPDVVNVHFPDWQILLLLSLHRRYRFRLVVSLHGHDVARYFNDATDSRTLSALLAAADAVTACSRHLLERTAQLDASVAAKGRVIYNGVASERFNSTARHLHPRPYIFAFGRLTHQKGFDLLLRAFGRIAATCSGVDLIVAGDGEEHSALAQLINKLGLVTRVFLYGRATPDEIVKLLNGSNFVVVPSRYEPFGIVALEALAAGKVVLATTVGGLPEFVSGPGNKLVPPTEDALAEALMCLLGQPDRLATFAESNRTLAARFSWGETCRRYAQVLEGQAV